MKRYSFPEHGVTIEAASREEAEKKLRGEDSEKKEAKKRK